MSKALVVCCDGTWDAPVESRATSTNVYKLWRAVAETNDAGDEQRVYYHEGVGTGGRLDRWLGGGFGLGVAHAVCDCYRFLAVNFKSGDKLYLFGFSRGAYTARSLAGMIRNCGILKPQNLGLVGEAFQLYRDRGKDPKSGEAQDFRTHHSTETPIHFIGVWADASPAPFVHETWQSLVVPHHHLFIGLLVAGEALAGALVLATGRVREVALSGLVAFNLTLVVFGWGFAIWGVPLAVGLLLLVRADRTQRSAASVRSPRRRPSAGASSGRHRSPRSRVPSP